MDALKKAEEEKRRAAKQLKEVEEPERAEDVAVPEEQSLSNTAENPVVNEALSADRLELTLEPLDGSMGDILSEEDDSHFDPTQDSEVLDKTHDEVEGSFSEDLTIENTITNELPSESLEATQEAVDLDDTSVIEGLSVESASAPIPSMASSLKTKKKVMSMKKPCPAYLPTSSRKTSAVVSISRRQSRPRRYSPQRVQARGKNHSSGAYLLYSCCSQ